MDIDQASLEAIVTTTWSTVPALTLVPDADTEAHVSDPIAAAVRIDGDWHGEVVLECSAPLAAEAAAKMLGASALGLTDDDLRDALGELSNIVAGNVKELLAGSSRLGLPRVAAGAYEADGSRVVCRAAFAKAGMRLRVTLRAAA